MILGFHCAIARLLNHSPYKLCSEGVFRPAAAFSLIVTEAWEREGGDGVSVESTGSFRKITETDGELEIAPFCPVQGDAQVIEKFQSRRFDGPLYVIYPNKLSSAHIDTSIRIYEMKVPWCECLFARSGRAAYDECEYTAFGRGR